METGRGRGKCPRLSISGEENVRGETVRGIYKSLFTENTVASKEKKHNSASINTTATKSMTVDDPWYWKNISYIINIAHKT